MPQSKRTSGGKALLTTGLPNKRFTSAVSLPNANPTTGPSPAPPSWLKRGSNTLRNGLMSSAPLVVSFVASAFCANPSNKPFELSGVTALELSLAAVAVESKAIVGVSSFFALSAFAFS